MQGMYIDNRIKITKPYPNTPSLNCWQSNSGLKHAGQWKDVDITAITIMALKAKLEQHWTYSDKFIRQLAA
jgi:hypothetical protein